MRHIVGQTLWLVTWHVSNQDISLFKNQVFGGVGNMSLIKTCFCLWLHGKSTRNMSSNCALIQEIMDMSQILLAVIESGDYQGSS